jgi:hypothetical protein
MYRRDEGRKKREGVEQGGEEKGMLIKFPWEFYK